MGIDMPAQSVTYVLSPVSTIAAVSGAWDDFARANGAPELVGEAVIGTSIWAWVGGPDTRTVLGKLLDRAFAGAELRGIGYRCDSPELRRFMEVDASLEADGMLRLTHRLVRAEPREQPAELLARSSPRAADLIRMCSWCNAVYVENAGWLEIEEAARVSPLLSRVRQPSITHGVCDACMESLTRMADGGPPARAPAASRGRGRGRRAAAKLPDPSV